MVSEQRMSLSRILAVNWYGYRQIIDVGGLTLITGANGSGKSALLDLIQLVMLGEQTSKFNKAAAGAGSGRSLRGYCLCDTNTVGRDGQERYLRPSGVTLAALEFTGSPRGNDSTPHRETWGARIEYESPTAKPRTVWFYVPGRITELDFLNEMSASGNLEFQPEDVFRVQVKRSEGEVFDRQKTYLDEMAHRLHLGFDRDQMNKTLPKAMAFQPVDNFETFIRDFLLEAALPDVRMVKMSVEAHRRAKERLDKMVDIHARLTRICDAHAAMEEARKEVNLAAHLRDAIKHEQCKFQRESLLQEAARKRADNDANEEASQVAISERDELRDQLESVRQQFYRDDTQARMETVRGKLEAAKKELAKLIDLQKTARHFLQDKVRQWQDWLQYGTRLGLQAPSETAAEMALLRGSHEARGLDAIARLARICDGLMADAKDTLRGEDEAIRQLESRERQLIAELAHFQEGRAAASPLLDALRARGQRAVALGRVVEVTNEGEKWWPLLEALLANDRQAVLPEDYLAAWEQAQHVKSPTEPLINPTELEATTAKTLGGSLRNFVQTLHPQAGLWLDHRLGNVMPVKLSIDLDRHERAMSLDGWLKDPPRRVKLVPEKDLTLGETGLKRMREAREAELEEVRSELEAHRKVQQDWRTYVQRAKDWHLDDATIPTGTTELRRWEEVSKEVEMQAETYQLLASPEREEAARRVKDLERRLEGAIERIARLDERMKKFRQEDAERTDRLSALEENEKQSMLSRLASRAKLTGILDKEIEERLAQAAKQFSDWNRREEAAAELQRSWQVKTEKELLKRDEERRALVAPSAHPELAEVYDANEPNNDRYALRLRELEDQELAKYRDEALRASREWEERLQHQVLDVLREKLDEADRTKKELNRAMDHEIGGWRYQLSSAQDRAHTAIWTLVEKGLPSGEGMDLFNSNQQDELARAKKELMEAIDAVDQPGDSRKQRALDYRYYHHWDIKAQPAGHGEAASISLNRSAKKQSGGENQAPFFVAMLAAFQRVYDLGARQQKTNLGLVVMDEAFSKLSGDRIDHCLALARNFGLQLVMAFPEDRLPTMINHADTVVQCHVKRSYDAKSGVVSNIENNVVLVTRDHLREILA